MFSQYWSQQSTTFFFKGFSAKQQKKPKKAASYSVIEAEQNALSDNYMENIIKCSHPKMTGQNDRPDESLTGQAHDQAGHCPLTGRYFEPWIYHGFAPFKSVFNAESVAEQLLQKYNLYSGLVALTVTTIKKKKLKAHRNSRWHRLASDLLPPGWKRAARFLQIIPRPTTKI